MKKILILVLVLALLPLSLLACSGGRNADVHVFYYTYSDTYISSVRASLNTQLDAAGVTHQDYDGGGNQTTQTEQIRTAITKGARVILVNIVNTGSDDAANEIVELAKGANVSLVFFNREVSDSVVNGYDKCAFIGTRAEEAGILQGEMIGEYLVSNYAAADLNGDGELAAVEALRILQYVSGKVGSVAM